MPNFIMQFFWHALLKQHWKVFLHLTTFCYTLTILLFSEIVSHLLCLTAYYQTLSNIFIFGDWKILPNLYLPFLFGGFLCKELSISLLHSFLSFTISLFFSLSFIYLSFSISLSFSQSNYISLSIVE